MGKITYKPYECTQCGYRKEIDTNHYGECYSWGRFNVCSNCPPYKRPTTWKCLEQAPQGESLPEPWTNINIENLKPKTND